MMIYGETLTQWKNHVVTKIKDNKNSSYSFLCVVYISILVIKMLPYRLLFNIGSKAVGTFMQRKQEKSQRKH